jgi:subtilisin family serine protease
MKKTLYIFSILVFTQITSCRTLKLTGTTIGEISNFSTAKLDWDKVNDWQHANIENGEFPGISVTKAYNDLLKDKDGKSVIVAVIDTGIDIDHEDLKNVVWVNEGEIPNNMVDDDGNGYVDDIHGWNFLGDSTGDQYELIRMLKKDTDFETKPLAIQKYAEMIKEDGIEDAVDVIEKNITRDLMHYNDSITQAKKLTWNPRATGDDPDDFSNKFYGDGNILPKTDDEYHGTHVAGIIAAQRHNGVGMDGIAANVKIMTLRAVPNKGDEYDKDIVYSIRYAADNGAHIINMSFGKNFSPHSDKVREAIIYAESKGVFIVNAAGNDGANIDQKQTYPNDSFNNAPEVSGNLITIGAIGPVINPKMVAPFSNFGIYNLDVFAPGAVIYSTITNDNYQSLSGTSMAAPTVSGVAALLYSYYPKLSPSAVKKVLMQSAVPINFEVVIGNESFKTTLDQVSQTGGVVNAYNALLYVSNHYKSLRKL